MTREQRAKQFMPFDAMKGLKEALLLKEEKHSRVERHGISDEERKENSKVLGILEKGDSVLIDYYSCYHDVSSEGTVNSVDMTYRYLVLDEEKIYFEDIYRIRLR